jgi:hypothetical protein
MSTTVRTVVLSRKALEIGVKGLDLDMETLALQINDTAEMKEAGLSITADELENLVRTSKIKTRNIKRVEKTVTFEVSEEEGPVGAMRLPNLVIRITQPDEVGTTADLDADLNEVINEVTQQHVESVEEVSNTTTGTLSPDMEQGESLTNS